MVATFHCRKTCCGKATAACSGPGTAPQRQEIVKHSIAAINSPGRESSSSAGTNIARLGIVVDHLDVEGLLPGGLIGPLRIADEAAILGLVQREP
jgi:hypothetical protein